MKLDLKKMLDLYLGGSLILLFRPIVVFLGFILKRDHSQTPKGDITIIKLQGGGSLVIGLSALLAIKRSYPEKNLQIVTTKAIASFAKTLCIFDKIIIIDDSNLFALFKSSIKSLILLFRTDTIIDWEVYSRLTTIFALFTCARNRIGFYREDVKSRKNFSTHLVYFNLYYGSWFFYNELSKLIGCKIPTNIETKEFFIKSLNLNNDEVNYDIAIGAGCSDLAVERMLSPSQWAQFCKNTLSSSNHYKIVFLGGPADFEISNLIQKEMEKLQLNIQFTNLCGKTSLIESIKHLNSSKEYWGIDSALLHYARLLGVKTNAFYGPTSPQSLIKPLEYISENIHYKQVPCSPCVHVTETPPCQGNNKCIQNLFI